MVTPHWRQAQRPRRRRRPRRRQSEPGGHGHEGAASPGPSAESGGRRCLTVGRRDGRGHGPTVSESEPVSRRRCSRIQIAAGPSHRATVARVTVSVESLCGRARRAGAPAGGLQVHHGIQVLSDSELQPETRTSSWSGTGPGLGVRLRCDGVQTTLRLRLGFRIGGRRRGGPRAVSESESQPPARRLHLTSAGPSRARAAAWSSGRPSPSPRPESAVGPDGQR